jgi:hypothetical protein
MKLPKGMTQKQLELLLLITPKPLGKGKTILEAAKILDISRQAATKRLNNFKKNFPAEYKNWDRFRKLRSYIRQNLHDKYPKWKRLKYGDRGSFSYNEYIESKYINKKNFYYNPIKEKF